VRVEVERVQRRFIRYALKSNNKKDEELITILNKGTKIKQTQKLRVISEKHCKE
jgi:hypothetical protein